MRTQIKRRWQETFNIDEVKITVVVKMRTRVGNFTGYSAKITDNKGHEMTISCINKLRAEDAQEIAYVRFVKKFY